MKWTKIVAQLLIGIVLCSFVVVYLESHPAEKVWLESSVMWLVQKVQTTVYELIHGKSGSMQLYQSLVMWYQDLIDSAKNCKLSTQEFQVHFDSLRSWWIAWFESTQTQYIDYYQEFKSLITQKCQ